MGKIFNVSSEKQSGGVTSGINNNQNSTINTYIWKGRKEGFFVALGIAIIVEIIIRLIF
ncbi:MAG: hypothetical protein WDZ80_05665 [Candidatus Paceibacterota bacterium]